MYFSCSFCILLCISGFFSKYSINICICLVKLRHSYHIFICRILETLFKMDLSSNVKSGTQIRTICVHFSNLSSFDWSWEFTLLIILQIWMWQVFFFFFIMMFLHAKTYEFLTVPRIFSFVNSNSMLLFFKIHLFS